MLQLSRNAPKSTCFTSRRSLAQIANANTNNSPSTPATLQHGRVPIREDHGLWHFFRRKQGEKLAGEARYETIEHPSRVEQSKTGRAWKASELRLKSFEDLHALWYIVLRERNLLATQKEEARRMGISDTGLQVSAERVHQCRKTMARIKVVLNERRLAYEGATKLIEEQKQQVEDEVVLQYQREKLEEERARVLSRRELTERRRAARSRKEEEARQATIEGASVEAEPANETIDVFETTESKSEASASMEGQKKVQGTDCSPKTTVSAVDTALFGGVGQNTTGKLRP